MTVMKGSVAVVLVMVGSGGRRGSAQVPSMIRRFTSGPKPSVRLRQYISTSGDSKPPVGWPEARWPFPGSARWP
jgi:hypothetical protein